MLRSIPMLRTLTAAFVALCVAAGTAHAQFGSPFNPWQSQQPPQPHFRRPAAPKPQQPQAEPQTQASAPAAQDQPAPYDPDLQRLSEILGALHFLRGICGSNEGQKWRDEAQALIDAEAPSGQRHEAMVASFNRGYRGFQQSYRTCTPAAGIVIRRYVAEGASIAREITARYAN
jgi:uncharacterized protein (TIGR02301 family)